MRKIVLTFGLIAGAIMCAMMLATAAFVDRIGLDTGAIIGYTTMVVAFLMVFFGVKSYRDNVAGGEISFARALSVGVLIVVIASTCYVATWEVLYYTVWPDFADKYAALSIEKARAEGVNAAELAQKQKEMAEFSRSYRNPFYNVAVTYLEPLPVGLLIAIVSAAVVRRGKNGALRTASGSND